MRAPTRLIALGLCALLHHAGPAHADYPLDDIPRVMPEGGALPCEHGALPLVRYRGEHLHYQKPLSVHTAFQSHLVAFEALVVQVATRHYGRAPQRIVHIGGYACRRMRRYPSWVSEHALGNAIDVAGFDFAPLPRRAQGADGVAPGLRRGFQVRLDQHWHGQGKNAPHAAFLHDLAKEITQHPEVFSVLLGPGYPGHHNHFHLDFAPYRLIDYAE
jgi:hypothetical protein